MSQDEPRDDDVSLSDGHIGPETTGEPQSSDDELPEFLPKRLFYIGKQTISTQLSRANEELPIPLWASVSIVTLYFIVLTAVAVLVHPFNAFGFLSLTTGAIMLFTIYHPDGVISPVSKNQLYLYTACSGAFVLIGLQYLLMGVLFDYPGFW